jgi:hypothetical protein
MADKTASEPFIFYSRFHLSESTGLKAANIEELLYLTKEVPGSCIYHHTHRFLQQHERLSPEPPNDFAYWVSEELCELELAERLASIDIIQFQSIRGLREKIVAIIEKYIEENPLVKNKAAKRGREFYFIKSVSFVLATGAVVHDLKEFAEMLEKVNINSIYFHIFEARLRLDNKTSDFANWIEKNIGDKELADKINRLDPYTYAIDDLRKALIKIIQKRIAA